MTDSDIEENFDAQSFFDKIPTKKSKMRKERVKKVHNVTIFPFLNIFLLFLFNQSGAEYM